MKGNRLMDSPGDVPCDRVFWVMVQVIDEENRLIKDGMSWKDLSWDIRRKWDWYFKYRAALLQVKYPRMRVEMTWGSGLPTRMDQAIRIHKNKLAGKKASITKTENLLRENREYMQKCKKEHSGIFPIEEDPQWKEALCVLDNLEIKLDRLKTEFVELTEKGP